MPPATRPGTVQGAPVQISDSALILSPDAVGADRDEPSRSLSAEFLRLSARE
jgi:hypothetical protein